MALFNKQPQHTKTALRLYAGVAIVYIATVMLVPVSKAVQLEYHFSIVEYRIVYFAIILPTLLVWLAAFFAYGKLEDYAETISKSPEQADFTQLARGSRWLAWSLPAATITATLLNAIANAHPGFKPTSIILANYVALILPLIGFGIVGIASRGLISRAKVHFSIASARLVIFAFLAAGVLYCYLIFQHLNSDSLIANDNPFYLPVWLIVLTIIVPNLYAWFVGLLATYEIRLFSRNVKGVLYRQSLQYLSMGLVIVIGSAIALQYLGTVQPRVGHLVIDYKLFFTMLFRVIGGVGWVLIAIGATKLKRIEDV